MQAIDDVHSSAMVLVLFGDVPLIEQETLEACISAAEEGIGVVTVDMPAPDGFGRIQRGRDGESEAIVEDSDATPAQRTITEINTGILAVPATTLASLLKSITARNAQGEYYLTDIVGLATSQAIRVVSVSATSAPEVQGINDRVQLALGERHLQRREAERLMASGVTIADPSR